MCVVLLFVLFPIGPITALPLRVHNLRELVNYRHPGPRRVWKVGSELQSTTLDQLDPLDPALCPKVWFCVRETILFPPEASPGPGLARPGPEGRPWEDLGELWEATVGMFKTKCSL